MSNLVTIHIITELPWSNLNRDDTGLPKRTIQGGVARGLLSSQSIKRGSRVMYEAATKDISYRSANLVDKVVSRVLEMAPQKDSKEVLKEAKKRINALTKGGKKTEKNTEGTEGGEGGTNSIWLSAEELETLANAIAVDSDADFISPGRTGALAIAGFGRMFASSPELQTEAAVAVSPAVSTHATVFESDYFTTGEDLPTEEQMKGATYLGVAHYINGVFYRSVTVDRDELRRNWTGIDQPTAKEQLEQFVRSLVYGMPRGKENSTAPYTYPAVVLVEGQQYRAAYDFGTPVKVNSEGGYLEPTIQELRKQRESARSFDARNFTAPMAIAGTFEHLDMFEIENTTDLDGIADAVASWCLEN